ncbi:restriction endonuclease subunit S [Acinetobacter schindleri]|uniref:restriction endonuclease subunit S n=1 Tax=Acinetobacter schindleri TaxID=108981 RepID=UPI0034D5B7B7
MAKYQKYAEYKDSGVEWLGEIPNDWEMWKLSHAYTEIGSGTTPSTSNEENFEGNIPWVTTGELRENLILDTKKKVSQRTIEQFPTLKKYPIGSVAIAMYGATIGRLGIFGIEATTNQACCVMTTSKVLNNKYVFYWLQAFKNEIIQLSSGGGQPNINQEKVASLKISAPFFEDQINIANFLDHETAKIDSLIAKQEKLIELLKEKRQAVISHAVTKGLNPDAAMKDSGVEWLGQVPEHWNVIKFNHCVQIRNGLVDPRHENYKNLILYAPNHIDKGTGKILYKETAEEQGADSNKYLCFKGEVIYSKIRPALAKVAICEEDSALCSADMYPMDGFNGLSNKFLYYFILSDSFTEAVILDSDRVAMPKINRESLSEYKLPIPPLEEQKRIIDFIETIGWNLDKLEQQAQKAIQLMQERRIALISSAVTGKIDVRNWQHPNEAKMEFSA